MQNAPQVAVAKSRLAPPRPVSATIIPFAPYRGGTSLPTPLRFTLSDRTALIALGYALTSWEIAFEQDDQGMQWATLCPPGGNGRARYIAGREGRMLALLSATGETLGRYEIGASLTGDVRRREQARCLHPAKHLRTGETSRRRLRRVVSDACHSR
jgi:hypothetical protein